MGSEGSLELQVCSACGHVQYPDRELCANCLADEVPSRPADDRGRLLSWTLIHASIDPVFRDGVPWRVGAVALDAGPILITHLAADVNPSAPGVRVTRVNGPDGRAVWLAYPADGNPPKTLRDAAKR